MFSKKEVAQIFIIVLVIAFSISLLSSFEKIFYYLALVFAVVAVNLIAKKITSSYLDSEIEARIWESKRFGFREAQYFKRPIPMGAILPILTSVFSLGTFTWLASLVFDVKPNVYKVAKRHGLFAFSEMTEYEVGMIAASGIVINLIAAVASYLIGYDELARLNIYYAFFNMIPLSDLDGNKIFFGSLIMWSFLAALTLVGLGYALLIV
ncbi:hypothetical protein HY448_02790 [Candidatus Pacearchaeota archaeon]|nr:hypothetical protein [Candidatus Pacearchaeota archaeon]